MSKYAFYGILLQVAVYSTAIAFDSEGQNESLEKIPISIHIDNKNVEQSFWLIEQQTDFKFAYRRQDLPQKLLTIHHGTGSLANLLRTIASQTQLSFKRIGSTIYVKKAAPEKGPLEELTIRIIKGRVIDGTTDLPLPGVNVFVKGTALGTSTDAEGYYQLETPDDDVDVLIFSFIGFQSKEIRVGTQEIINVTMEAEIESLREVVVIGYGTRSRHKITDAVSKVSADQIRDLSVSSFDQALVGKVAGVQVLQTTGAPGGNISIRVRGIGSISGGNDPLYVIDGVPISDAIGNSGSTVNSYDSPINPLNAININDIESIEVLKDASAAAIYGSRGANGVVLITTKRGKEGTPVIQYNGYVSFQQVTKKIDMMGAYEYAELSRDAHNNAYTDQYGDAVSVNDSNAIRRSMPGWRTHFLIPEQFEPYLAGVPGLTDTDWQDEIFRTAPMTGHSLSISGGTGTVNYFVSGDYIKQDGVVINSGFEKYSTRINLDIRANDKFSAGVNFTPSYSSYDKVNGEGPFSNDGVVGTALTYSPVWPVYNSDGSYNFDGNVLLSGYAHTDQVNPVALARLIENKLDHLKLLGNIFAEYEIIKGLTYKISVGTDINNYQYDYYRPSTVERAGTRGPSNPTGISRTTNYLNWVIENTLRYEREWGGHNLSLLAGYTAQKERSKRNWLEATDFPNDLVHTLNGGIVPEGGGGTEITEWSLLSGVGRLQYDYQGKYLVSAALRADGSSRFGKSNRWGYFPSVSAGWRITEEAFLNDVKFLTDLKFRASYGLTGNFQIPNYGSIALISADNYTLNNALMPGLRPSSLPNDALGWEKTKMYDIGLDMGLFDQQLLFTFDYYNSLTTDLLLNIPVSRITGFDTSLQNYGEVSNKGYEVALTWQKKGDVSWNITANFSSNKNRVERLGPENAPIIVNGGHSSGQFITRAGDPIGSYFTLVQDGVFMSEAELDSYPHFADSRPGDFRYVDTDGSGTLDVDKDKTVTGSYLPDYIFGLTGGVNFKGLDLNVSLQGSQGNKIMNLLKRYILNMEGNFNSMQETENRWQSEEDPGDGHTVRPNRRATGRNIDANNRLIEDGSYLRVRSITLGYTLPQVLLQRVEVNKVRLYVSALNPFTFTDYSGFNPEINSRPNNALAPGEDYGTYPLAKSYTLGINISF